MKKEYFTILDLKELFGLRIEWYEGRNEYCVAVQGAWQKAYEEDKCLETLQSGFGHSVEAAINNCLENCRKAKFLSTGTPRNIKVTLPDEYIPFNANRFLIKTLTNTTNQTL